MTKIVRHVYTSLIVLLIVAVVFFGSRDVFPASLVVLGGGGLLWFMYIMVYEWTLEWWP
jgi:uncharacterized membrane protein (UPF0136 family)